MGERRALLERIAQKMGAVTHGYGEALIEALPDDLSKWQIQQLETRAQIISAAELTNMKGWRLLKDYAEQTELEEGIRDNAFSAQQSDDRIETIRAFMRYASSTDLSAGELSEHWRSLLQKVKAQNMRCRGTSPWTRTGSSSSRTSWSPSSPSSTSCASFLRERGGGSLVRVTAEI